MKTKLLLFTLFISAMSFAQYTAIPDANFEEALGAYDDIANDGQVPTANINTVTNLDVSAFESVFGGASITDLTGIQDFTALQTLDCSENQLTSLDISSNLYLINLDCSDNQLTSLDISQNTALQTLDCSYNQLTSLNVIQNTTLTGLACYSNQLTNLDVTQNTALIGLAFGDTQLNSIDLSQNINLEYLACYLSPAISDLDLTQNTNLTHLELSYFGISSINLNQNINLENILVTYCNNLSTLNLTSNVNLQYVTCENNTNLVTLNIKNNNNTNIHYENGGDFLGYYFYATNNPNLTCIEVDDSAWSTTNWTNIDSWASFSTDCHVNETFVPDPNFENYLETHDANGNIVSIGNSNSMGNGIANDNYVTTASINTVTNLDVSYLSIADLTGIEDFTALTNLACHHNNLIALNVTQNTSLTELFCGINQITNLDITQNTSLTKLYCYNNQLMTLNIAQNTALTDFRCYNNSLTSLDVTSNVNLITFECDYNQITNLDLSQNTVLVSLHCATNGLTALDVSLNTVLTYLNCQDNQLTSLNVKNGNNTNFYGFIATNNPNLTCIEVDDPAWSTANWNQIDPQTNFSSDCSTNGLTYVPDDNFEQELINLGYDTGALDDYVPTNNINSVVSLNVGQKNIADLTGIEDFAALQYLYCYGNQLASLNVTQNNNLKVLSFEQNQIPSIDISQNTQLEELYTNYNLLTNIDISQNQLLKKIYLSNNNILNLNLSNHPALTQLSVSGNNLTNLDVSTNPLLEVLDCGSNNLTNLDISSNLSLTHFNCAVNHISNIDISQHSNIIRLFVFNNDLTYLNVANSNNINFLDFNASYNPDLTCIIVDDATWSNANWSSFIDPTSTFVNNQAACDALSVADTYFENNLRIYPNPAQNQVNIQIDRNAAYKIYNINGQLLIKGTVSQGNNTLDIKNIRQGIYFIKITDNHTEITKKLIIK